MCFPRGVMETRFCYSFQRFYKILLKYFFSPSTIHSRLAMFENDEFNLPFIKRRSYFSFVIWNIRWDFRLYGRFLKIILIWVLKAFKILWISPIYIFFIRLNNCWPLYFPEYFPNIFQFWTATFFIRFLKNNSIDWWSIHPIINTPKINQTKWP